MSAKANFMALTYLHLAGALGVTAVSAEYPLVKANTWAHIGFVALSFVFLFGLLWTRPGPLKYILFALFSVALGQMLGPLVQRLQDKGILRQVLIMVVGIFVGMTALAFYDRGSFLGFGPYLMAGLVGLIVAHVVGIVLGLTGAVTAKTFHNMSQVFAWIGTALFTVFIAYDTQKMKVRAAKEGSKTTPDYIDASLNLYLDVINLFSDVGHINS
jgi:FtsH-binding integral membrane protein